MFYLNIKNIFIKNIFFYTTITYIFIQLIFKKYHNISCWYQITNILNSNDNLLFLAILVLTFNKIKANKFICFNFIVILLFFKNFQYNQEIIYQNFSNLNLNLINGIMLIHPNILYISYTLFFLKIFNGIIFSKKYFQKNIFKKNIYKYILLLVTFTTILGMYWAEQELFWGGWWSWDFIELIILNIIMYILYIYHINTINVFFIKNLPIKMFCILIISILVVRYNIINSIHNFINANNYNQYDYYLIILILNLTIILIKKLLNITNTYTITLFIIVTIVVIYIIFIYNIYLYTFLKIKILLFILINTFICYILTLNNKLHLIQLLYMCYINIFLMVILIYNIFLYVVHILVRNKMQHICIIFILYFLNQQILVFSGGDCFKIILELKQIKTNIISNIDIYQNYFLIKEKSFLEDLSNNLLNNIFEKNILSYNNTEIYNYNNQSLNQIGFSMLYIPIITILVTFKKFFFLNKEHCWYINI